MTHCPPPPPVEPTEIYPDLWHLDDYLAPLEEQTDAELEAQSEHLGELGEVLNYKRRGRGSRVSLEPRHILIAGGALALRD